MKVNYFKVLSYSIIILLKSQIMVAQNVSQESLEKRLVNCINSFIDNKDTSNTKSTISQYRVYVVYFDEYQANEQKFVFSISYIKNSYLYKFINATHYYKYKNRYTIIRHSTKINNLDVGTFKKINNNVEQEIINVLFDNSKPYNFITGTSKAAIYRYKNGNLHIEKFQRYEDLPDSLYITDNEYIKKVNDSVIKSGNNK